MVRNLVRIVNAQMQAKNEGVSPWTSLSIEGLSLDSRHEHTRCLDQVRGNWGAPLSNPRPLQTSHQHLNPAIPNPQFKAQPHDFPCSTDFVDKFVECHRDKWPNPVSMRVCQPCLENRRSARLHPDDFGLYH